jgi:hypothetical protein
VCKALPSRGSTSLLEARQEPKMNRVSCLAAALVAAAAFAACSQNTPTDAMPGAPSPMPTPTPAPAPAAGFALAGHAQEMGATAASLGSVRVAIVRGDGAGTAVMTDAAGSFRFDHVSGVVDVEATKSGYVPWRVSNLTIDHDTTLDVSLYPTPPTNAGGQAATARCGDGTWTWSTGMADACVGHGGIMYGVCPGPLCTASVSR